MTQVRASRQLIHPTTLFLRETEAAEEWLEQFEPGDKKYASILLEGLELVSDSTLEKTLESIVVDELSRVKSGSIALFAVRELEGDDGQLPLYFDPNQPTARPNAVGLGGGVGSEGMIATLIRDLSRKYGSRVLDHPSIACMRATRSRIVMLLDDVVGSGKRMVDFHCAMLRHRTIRSWLSLGYIRLVPTSFGVTSIGLKELARRKSIAHARYERDLIPGGGLWTREQRHQVERVCRKYSNRTSRPGMPMGFRSVFSTIVFEHKCPNTAPAILWSSKKSRDPREGWTALFQGRPRLGFSAWPVALSTAEHARTVMTSAGQHRLASGVWEHEVVPGARLRLMVLAILARSTRSASTIASMLQVSQTLAKELLKSCEVAEWITAGNYITPAGRAELDKAKTLGDPRIAEQVEEKPLALKSFFYYPRTLRATGAST